MNIRDIPLPLVLGENRRVHPTRVSINLAITPLSDASMSLPQGESLPARGYVELFTCMGSAGVFRVRSPQDAYGMVTTTAELEHAIVEVGDYLVKAKYDEMMAANTAMQTIFSHYGGSRWQLGSVSALGSGQIALQANYDRVLEAMLAILEQKPDCMMSFDFSTSPWTVSIVARGTTVTAEGRLARNVNSAKVIYDDTELCTRAYYEKKTTTDSTSDVDLSGFPTFDATQNYSRNAYVVYQNKLYQLTAGHVKDVTWANTTKVLVDDIPTTVWQYVDADTIGTYGRIEREVRTGSSDTDAEALQTVNEYLSKHKHPRVSVDISAIELSHITGEAFDTFTIGKLFRLCLADYNNLTVEKNVINLYFDDVYERPENITVTLAEEEDTALTFIHDVDAKGGSGGGGGGGKKQDDVWKEFQTHFDMDDKHIALYAQQWKNAEEILRDAGLYIDANGVLIYAQDNEKNIGSKIQAEADRISLVVEGYGNNATIKRAAIILAITDGESSVQITADYIDIDGIVSELQAYDIQCESIYCTTESNFDGGIYTTDISGAGAYFDTGSFSDLDVTELNGHDVEWKSQQVITDMSTSGNYAYWAKTDSNNSGVTGHAYQKMITDITLTTKTLNYLSY